MGFGTGNLDFHQSFHRQLSTFRLANVAFLQESCEQTSLQTLSPSVLCRSEKDQLALTQYSASITFATVSLRCLESQSSLTLPFVLHFLLHLQPFSHLLRLNQLQQLLSRRRWPY